MDLDPHTTPASLATLDSPAASSSANIVAEDDVNAFVSKNGIQAEYDKVSRQLESAFSPESVSVSIVPSYEDDSDRGTLVFMLKCSMEQKAFRAATERFFESIFSENPRIYRFIAVLRDA